MAVKKMSKKQPVMGTNMPSSATSKKMFGPIAKQPVELNRFVDKAMKGSMIAGAGETPEEDKMVNAQSANVGPDYEAGFTRGMKGQMTDSPVPPTRADRVNAGTAMLNGKSAVKDSEEEAVDGAPKSYKDWQKLGETPSHMIVAVSKKKVQL